MSLATENSEKRGGGRQLRSVGGRFAQRGDQEGARLPQGQKTRWARGFGRDGAES